MKTLKAISATAILALALSIPAHAGEVQTPGYIPPPPPPPEELNVTMPTATPFSPGEMSSPTPLSMGDVTPGFADILWVLASIF